MGHFLVKKRHLMFYSKYDPSPTTTFYQLSVGKGIAPSFEDIRESFQFLVSSASFRVFILIIFFMLQHGNLFFITNFKRSDISCWVIPKASLSSFCVWYESSSNNASSSTSSYSFNLPLCLPPFLTLKLKKTQYFFTKNIRDDT